MFIISYHKSHFHVYVFTVLITRIVTFYCSIHLIIPFITNPIFIPTISKYPFISWFNVLITWTFFRTEKCLYFNFYRFLTPISISHWIKCIFFIFNLPIIHIIKWFFTSLTWTFNFRVSTRIITFYLAISITPMLTIPFWELIISRVTPIRITKSIFHIIVICYWSNLVLQVIWIIWISIWIWYTSFFEPSIFQKLFQ